MIAIGSVDREKEGMAQLANIEIGVDCDLEGALAAEVEYN